MSYLLNRYCTATAFADYDDLKNNFAIRCPEDFNFGYDCVDAWAEHEPQKLALVWTNDAGDMKRYSFLDVKHESNRAANLFRSFGIRKGDVVMLILKQRPEVWFAMTALHKMGAVVIPASFQLTPHDLVYRLNASGAKLIVAVDDDYVMENINTALAECKSVEHVLSVGEKDLPGMENYRKIIGGFSAEFPRPTDDQNTCVTDDMMIFFSSGTTGMPKMVLHDYSSPLGQISTAKFWQCVQENTVHMTQTDSGWAKFAWGKMYGQWLCGAAVGAYDTEKFEPKTMLAAIKRIRPTTLCLPATIFRVLIKEDISRDDFSFVEHATMAGEPLNPEVLKQLYEKTGLVVHEGFGQSESSVLVANFFGMEIRPGSMGKPAPGYDIDILDENLRRCEDGAVGSICIKNVLSNHPTGLFREYWKDEEAMKKSFRDDTYNTGDTAWRDADGYLWFVGRNDDVIKCSGYRIGPFEVESALMEHPSVLECAITAYPDELRGDVVKATVVLVKGSEGNDELKKELQNHVKHATAPYKYPRIVEFADELPKTTSGKIIRNQIRAADVQKYNANKNKSQSH
ncbi:MAG: AMP-binding protein [Oscillospiraceae bacterium]|jgi:acetyl-CoA synthetase|nr:AMP-binding protein [Oscillospiraceae bacterium]